MDAKTKLQSLQQIWRDSAERNRDSAVYWFGLARDFRVSWPEMVDFCVQRYFECSADAERDEAMALSLGVVE